jgi:uncharacterized surface protein with fasciclin (FAS1) repeats
MRHIRQMQITLVVGIAMLSAMSGRVMRAEAPQTAGERGDWSALKQQPIPVTDTGDIKIFLSLLKVASAKPPPNSGNRDNDWVVAVIDDLAAFRPGNDPLVAKKSLPSQTGSTFYTVFAPSDAAFGRLPKGAVEALRKNPERLKEFLRAHIVPGKITLADMLAYPNDNKNAADAPVFKTLPAYPNDNGGIRVSRDEHGSVLIKYSGGLTSGKGVESWGDPPAGKVVMADGTTYGAGVVIHVIEGVLVQPRAPSARPK